jgi:hypothetical protein
MIRHRTDVCAATASTDEMASAESRDYNYALRCQESRDPDGVVVHRVFCCVTVQFCTRLFPLL